MSGGLEPIRPMELHPRYRKRLNEIIQDAYLYSEANWQKVAKKAHHAGERLPSNEEWEVMATIYRAEYLLIYCQELTLHSPYIQRTYEAD